MIKVNDRDMNFNGTVKELLIALNINQNSCAVLVNGDIVKRENLEDFYLKEGDHVEIVSFVGGG